jgi:hypothetical protein
MFSIGLTEEISWLYFSTYNGDLPLPNYGNQQTASLVLDIDKDGKNDFVITERTQAPSVTWFKYIGGEWSRFVIENEPLRIEAGGDFLDIDKDGDLDILFGGDSRSNQIWWWENPYPNFEKNKSWKRWIVKNSGANKHHDQIFGDFTGDGKPELVSWNQRDDVLFLLEIPNRPQNNSEWKRTVIFKAENGKGRFEGLAKADIDLDGKIDIIGAGHWFKHQKGTDFSVNVIDDSPGREFTRCAAGQLVEGGRPEVVLTPGDADGPINWYEWKDGTWIVHQLCQEIIHGHSIAVKDINDDGFLDIFVAEMGRPGAAGNAKTFIYWGNGKGEFVQDIVATGKANHESKLGDLDGDGDIDILSKPYNYGSPGLHIWLQNKAKLSINKWERYQIDVLPERSMYIKAADLDGDGDKDLIAGGWWWENPGKLGGNWKNFTIGDPLKNMNEVADVDNDGDIDIVGTKGIGSSVNRQFVWAQNNGKGTFKILTNIDSCESGDFLQGSVLSNFGKGKGIALGWHKDGRGTYIINIPADPVRERWTIDLISPTTLKEDLSAGDIDGDGDMDLLLGDQWLQNADSNWITYNLGEVTDLDEDAEADRNDLVDVNGDGRLDATIGLELATPLLWFEAPEDPTQPWKRHSVGDSEGQGFSMDSRDFDRDGDPDIVVGQHRGETVNRVVIYENFDQGSTWIRHTIDEDSKDIIDHHDGTQAVDLDNDGDLDLISIGWYNPKVWIFENKAIE